MNGRKGKPDRRGSSDDRARRLTWLMWRYRNGQGGVDCVHCGTALLREQVQQDRIIPGGPYNRQNVQPSCASCNVRRGDSPITPFRLTA